MMDLISFGIVIDDIVLPDGNTHTGILGGGGPQTAWGMAAALGTGESVGVVADVGNDFDLQALAPLKKAHINLEGVRVMGAFTPRAWQHVDAEGSRRHTWQSPPPTSISARTSLDALLPQSYRSARRFHWGLHPENPTLEDARSLTTRGARVSLETFKPPEQPLTVGELQELMAACTVFSPNWLEAAGMTGSTNYDEVIQCFQQADCKFLALRRGAAGADVWDFEARYGVRVPAVPTQVIDTVGAGNAFCGALLATLDEGLETAACRAVAAASFLVEQFGLPAQLPNRTDFDARVAFAGANLTLLRFPPLP